MADDEARVTKALPDEDWEAVDEALGRFEQSWRAGGEPDLAGFVPPPGHHTRVPVLAALVKVDQEYRWGRGERRLLETYLKEWPELSEDREVLAGLVEAECFTRAAMNDLPTQQELEVRFPTVCDRIDLTALAGGPPPGPAVEVTTSPTQEADTGGLAGNRLPTGALPLRSRPCIAHRYEILDELGRGAMGFVYRAKDRRLGRVVALKVPQFGPDAGPETAARFLREGRAAAGLEHPNICRIYDAGEDQGVLYLTMELIHGQSLDKRIATKRPKDEEPMPVHEAVQLTAKLARAMAEVHRAGIVHRDIKPGNVMIDQHGQPRLMDFGLAQMTEANDALTTGSGPLAGTLPFLAPEQFRLVPADRLTDIYSLGVLLYQVLTDRLPFEGKMPADIVENVLRGKPERPSRLRREVDADLEAICLKAMARSREDRYQSADELAAALEQWLERHREKCRRRAIVRGRLRAVRIALEAVTAVAVLLGGIFYLKTGEGSIAIHTDQDKVKVIIDGQEQEVPVTERKVKVIIDGQEQEAPVSDRKAEVTVPVGSQVTIRLDGAEQRTTEVRITRRHERANVDLRAVSRWIQTNAAVADLQLTQDGKTLYASLGYSIDPVCLEAFDADTGKSVDVMPFKKGRPDMPGIGLSADGKFLFASLYWYDSILRVGLDKPHKVDALRIASDPTNVWAGKVAMTPNGEKLVVNIGCDCRPKDEENDQLSIVDVAGGKFALAGEVRLDDEPIQLTVPNDDFAYVVTMKRRSPGPTLYEVSLKPPYKVTRKLSFARASSAPLRGVAVSGSLGRIFVGDGETKTIRVVDLEKFNEISSFEPGGYAPSTLAINPKQTLLAAVAGKKVLLLDPVPCETLARFDKCTEGPETLRFSPDGRRLYVGQSGPKGGIGVIDLDGIKPRIKMVFASDRESQGEGRGIYRTVLGTGKVDQLTANDDESLAARWSPDGRQIAFISGRSGTAKVCVMDDGGKNLRRLDRTDPILGGECPLAWSPSGGQIVYIGGERQAVRVVDVATGQVETIVSGAVEDELIDHEAVSWRKSDGAILLVSVRSGQGNVRRLFRVDPATRKAVAITREGTEAYRCAGPAPSPDGKRIAFVQNPLRPGGAQRICTVNADGEDFHVLSEPPGILNAWLGWSSDGKRLAYTAQRDGKQQIFLLDVATGESTWFSDKASNDYTPDLFGIDVR